VRSCRRSPRYRAWSPRADAWGLFLNDWKNDCFLDRGWLMKITTISLLAALAAGEGLAVTPQVTPAVLVSGPGISAPRVQNVVYRRRRRVRYRRYYAHTRSKKKSAAIVAGSAAGGAAIGALAGGGKGAGIGAIAGGGAGLIYDQATRNKRR
jgi:hypothetical protein